jgi:hypothetical protein
MRRPKGALPVSQHPQTALVMHDVYVGWWAISISLVALVVAIASYFVNSSAARSAERSANAAEGSMGIAQTAADAARDSVVESRMARQDQLGTDVFIEVVKELGTRWIARSMNPRIAAAKPMEAVLSMPGNDRDRILAGAVLRIVNRGSSEAIIRVFSFRVDRVSPENWQSSVDESPSFGSIDDLVLDGTFVLGPHEEQLVLIRQGPTLQEWVEDRQYPLSVDISAYKAPEGVIQNWRLTVICSLLGNEPGNASSFRVQPFLQASAILKFQPRIYPSASGEIGIETLPSESS